jgi:hypothetical protein
VTLRPGRYRLWLRVYEVLSEREVLAQLGRILAFGEYFVNSNAERPSARLPEAAASLTTHLWI